MSDGTLQIGECFFKGSWYPVYARDSYRPMISWSDSHKFKNLSKKLKKPKNDKKKKDDDDEEGQYV